MSKLSVLDNDDFKQDDDLTVAELISLIKLCDINKELKLHKCITCDQLIKKRYKTCFECEYNIVDCRDCGRPIHHKYPTCLRCYENSQNTIK